MQLVDDVVIRGRNVLLKARVVQLDEEVEQQVVVLVLGLALVEVQKLLDPLVLILVCDGRLQLHVLPGNLVSDAD